MNEETNVIVALRLPASLKAWLQQQAKEQDRSVNYVGRQLIERAMEEKQGAGA
ncbi:MAG: hypothetical protein RR778_13630 [Glutamicibacter sp.]|uniref:hypothetical protein n=1 Tax=Glutamicibacter sp. TaxID=1931995 RepID=UPI002FCC7274